MLFILLVEQFVLFFLKLWLSLLLALLKLCLQSITLLSVHLHHQRHMWIHALQWPFHYPLLLSKCWTSPYEQSNITWNSINKVFCFILFFVQCRKSFLSIKPLTDSIYHCSQDLEGLINFRIGPNILLLILEILCSQCHFFTEDKFTATLV